VGFCPHEKIPKKWQLRSAVTPVAGPTLEAKNRAIFSGELFSEEELLPENSLLGQKMSLDFK